MSLKLLVIKGIYDPRLMLTDSRKFFDWNAH